MAFCPDFVYVAAQIIACNSVKRSEQGIAASLVGTLNLYGTSLGLGFAGTIETEVRSRGAWTKFLVLGLLSSFGAGIALLAVVLDLLFVRVVKDEREGWTDPADAEIDLGPLPHEARAPRLNRLQPLYLIYSTVITV